LEWYIGNSIQKSKDFSITIDQTMYLKQKLQEFKEFIPHGSISSPLPQNYQSLLQQAENEDFSTGNFPYRKIVGSLMYAMLCTRPDLACSISVVSQFLEKPKPRHIKLVQRKTVTILQDNQACIALTKNPEDHKRTKHIQVKYHVIREYVAQGLIRMIYCNTQDQLADIFTKGVTGHLLRTSLFKLGLIHNKELKSQP
jgi:hypothetical protein